MQNTKMLEMLNKGQINELKGMIEDEIYMDSLKKKPNANKRYTAMKKYFSYVNSARESLSKPCPIEFEGEKYTSFTNGYSMVFTKENTGEIGLFDPEKHNYPDVQRLISFDGNFKEIDLNEVIAKAKSKGYKLKISELSPSAKYLMHYDGAFFKIGLIDASYGIINDGKTVTAWHKHNDERGKLTLMNDFGYCVIMPVYLEDLEDKVVIEVDRDTVEVRNQIECNTVGGEK